MMMMKKKKGGGCAPFVPGDIVRDILVMLPAKSVARFRAVSKSWHALTTDSSFILSHAVRHGGAPNRATIASSETFWKGDSVFNLFTVTATGDIGPFVSIPMPTNTKECFCLLHSKCCHGLQCNIGILTNSFYICNILSKEWIAVVPFPSDIEKACLLSFYFHASTREYRLLTIFCRVKRDVNDFGHFEVEDKLAVATVGTNTWRYLNKSDCGYNLKQPLAARCITLNGKVHWVSCNDDLIHDAVCFFDTESEEFYKLSLPGDSWLFRYDVLEIEGRLGLCQVIDKTIMCIWELKDYAQAGKWMKRHTISFQGIKEAPNMFLLKPFQYVIALDSDKQVLYCRTETKKWENMFLYDLKLEELKVTPLRGYPLAPFSENTLISSKFFNKQEDQLTALRSM